MYLLFKKEKLMLALKDSSRDKANKNEIQVLDNKRQKKIGIDILFLYNDSEAQTKFSLTLPKPTSDLAQQLIKSEYNFESLRLADGVHEKVIEKAMIDHNRDFLIEFGSDFAFLGSQYKLVVGDEDFFCDLLFYHNHLFNLLFCNRRFFPLPFPIIYHIGFRTKLPCPKSINR